MSINIGRKQIAKLYRGSDKKTIVEVYKGGDLIYQDNTAGMEFSFDIDTRNYNATNKLMRLSFGYRCNYQYAPSIVVDWGDGNIETATWTSNSPKTIEHTYGTAGEYTVTLTPGPGGNKGWLSGFRFCDGSSTNYAKCYTAIHSKFPRNSYFFSNGNTNNSFNGAFGLGMSSILRNTINVVSCPDTLFDEVGYVVGYLSGISGNLDSSATTFDYAFSDALLSVPGGANVFGMAKTLFEKQKDNVRNFKTYNYTFKNMFFNTSTYVSHKTLYQDCAKMDIPEDLFTAFTGCVITSSNELFSSTFNNACYRMTDGTFPEHLFDPFSLPVSCSPTSMFINAFTNCYYNSKTVRLPGGVFKNILKNCKPVTLNALFSNTFSGCFYSADGGSIPADIFSIEGLDTSDVQNSQATFQSTFMSCFRLSKESVIPEGLFAKFSNMPKCINAKNMFYQTFTSVCSASTSSDPIPEGVIGTLNLPAVTDIRSMFEGTFSSCAANSTTALMHNYFKDVSIRKGNYGTNATRLFANTFNNCFGNSNYAQIPSGLFAFMDGVTFTSASEMFSQTFNTCFDHNTSATIPEDLFSTINTSNATTTSKMFRGTFYNSFTGSTELTIPENLFSTINTQNSTDFAEMFYQTFTYCGRSSQVATIPENLFSQIDTRRGTNFNSMFASTFEAYCNANPNAWIPGNLFQTIKTPLGTNFASMFQATFASCFAGSHASPSGNLTIPENLFSQIDTSSATSLSSMFSGTFKLMVHDFTVTIPVGLFSTIQTESAQNVSSMFYNTFFDTSAYGGLFISAGLFGGLKFKSGATVSGLFSSTFEYSYTYNWSSQPELTDVFEGMESFDWVTASNAANVLYKMFSAYGAPAFSGGKFSGSADTILKHFNFTPSSRTSMFVKQDKLDDFMTIATNWK